MKTYGESNRGYLHVHAEPGQLALVVDDPVSEESMEMAIPMAMVAALLTDLAQGAVVAYGPDAIHELARQVKARDN